MYIYKQNKYEKEINESITSIRINSGIFLDKGFKIYKIYEGINGIAIMPKHPRIFDELFKKKPNIRFEFEYKRFGKTIAYKQDNNPTNWSSSSYLGYIKNRDSNFYTDIRISVSTDGKMISNYHVKPNVRDFINMISLNQSG